MSFHSQHNSMNHGTAIGSVIADPTIVTNSDGSHRVLFTVRTQNAYTNRDGRTGNKLVAVISDYIRPGADNPFRTVKKGSEVVVDYEASTESYPDKNTGETRWTTNLVITGFRFNRYRYEQEALFERVAERDAARKGSGEGFEDAPMPEAEVPVVTDETEGQDPQVG